MLWVLAVASGIYTYLGVSSLLDGSGPMVFLAAIAYSIAVRICLIGIRSCGAVVTSIAYTIAVTIGLIGVSGSNAVVAGVAHAVTISIRLVRICD